jgi:hypothetical protein
LSNELASKKVKLISWVSVIYAPKTYLVVGIVFNVDLTYLGGQFAYGDGVAEVLAGRLIAGGG